MKSVVSVPALRHDEIERLTHVETLIYYDCPRIWIDRGADGRLWYGELIEDYWDSAGSWHMVYLYSLMPAGMRVEDMEPYEPEELRHRSERHWVLHRSGKKTGATYHPHEVSRRHGYGPYRPA